MIDSTRRFSDRVEHYVRCRPGYPPALYEHLYGAEGLSAASVIADIGAGTGLFSRGLLERGSRVFGVEPNGPMRRAGEEFLAAFPRFTAMDGTAEATGLPDGAVDAVVSAQAFHWFDAEAFRRELLRITRPGALAALVWNRRGELPGFGLAYEQWLREHVDEAARVDHKQLTDEDFRRFFRGMSWRRQCWSNAQELDLDGLKGRHLSTSYVPQAGQPGYEEQMAGLEALFGRFQQDGKVVMGYQTEAYLARVPAVPED